MSAAPRWTCSDASLERDEPQFATGSRFAAWLAIEVDGSWGPDALVDSELGALVPQRFGVSLERRGIRAVCMRRAVGVRHGDEAVDPARARTAFFCLPAVPGERSRLWRTELPLERVAEVAAGLTATPPSGAEWEVWDDPLVLVCTNGRHDQCCATKGRPVVGALREAPALAGLVWECSHIGGDRFAANLAVLPDSLYFGRCRPETVEALVSGVLGGVLDPTHFRGRTTYRWGQQAVEHFVREHTGARGVDAVRVGDGDDSGDYPVEVVGHGRFTVRVAGRWENAPGQLTCRGPVGGSVAVFELLGIEPRPR